MRPIALATGRALPRCVGAAACVGAWAILVRLAQHASGSPVLLSRYSPEYALLLGGTLASALLLTALQLSPVRSRLWALRYELVWAFVLCPLLAGGLLEVALRRFDLFGASFYGEINRYVRTLEPDRRLFYRNPTNHRGEYGGVSIATNELGLRERALAPPSLERWRILALGDSVTFGWGVRVEETFPRRLEDDLGRRGLRAETVNSGVVGYNTVQEETFLRLYGDTLKPDLVLLLYVDNDVESIDPGRVHMGIRPRFGADPLGAVDYSLSASRVYFMARHLAPGLLAWLSGVPPDTNAPGWRESMSAVTSIARHCRDRRIPLVLFQYRMVPSALGDALRRSLSALAVREGFRYSDTLPWFAGGSVRTLTNSFVDSHPNARGHRVLAEGMLSFLLREGLVPACPAGSDGARPRVCGPRAEAAGVS